MGLLNSHCGQEDISKHYVHLIQKKFSDIDFSMKIFCCPTCYKSFNSFRRSDTGEEVMFQSFQYINTCLHRYNFDDSVSQDNVDL